VHELRDRVADLTDRLEDVRASAADLLAPDLLAPDHLDRALGRIAARAADAAGAARYLLVVHRSPDAPVRLHHHGFTTAEAKALANELLAGATSGDEPDRITTAVAGRRPYGRLAALYAGAVPSPESCRRTLELYADYAARALDVANAAEDARRVDAVADAFSAFSLAVAGRTSLAEVVRALAPAVAEVAGCDRATVMVWDPGRETLTLEAMSPPPVAPSAPAPSPTPSATPAPAPGPGPSSVVHTAASPGFERVRAARSITVVDPETTDPALRALAGEPPMAAVALVPLFAADEFLGVATAGYATRPPGLVRGDGVLHERLTGLAAHAVAALERARLRAMVGELRWQDEVSGLPNQRLLADRVGQELRRSRRSGEPACLLVVEVGRPGAASAPGVPEALVAQAARRIVETIRRQDTVARLEDGAFAVLLPGAAGPDGPVPSARRIVDALAPPYLVGERALLLSASVGGAVAGGPDDTFDELLARARHAARDAAGAGSGSLRIDEAHLPHRPADVADQLAAELPGALQGGELFLVYQPRVDLRTNEVVGIEALTRWRHPVRGTLEGVTVVSAAARAGLGGRVDAWAVLEAGRQVRHWRQEGFALSRLSLNVMATDLADENFLRAVVEALALADLAPGALELELTESALSRALDAGDAIGRLRHLGVRFAVDDYGRGRSGLVELARLPVSTLKIDPALVGPLGADDEHDRVVAAVVAAGAALGVEVVAEGVETVHQRRRLVDLGCTMAQGFLLGPPLPAGDMAGALARRGAPSGPPGD